MNPAPAVKPPLPDQAEVETFTSGEIERMLAAADRFTARGKFRDGNRKRIRAMVLLLRYSGLRISDAAVLAKDRLDGDRLSLRTIKTSSMVWCPLPTKAVKALQESPSDDSNYFFWNGSSQPITAVKIWERTFQRVFELAEIPEHKAFFTTSGTHSRPTCSREAFRLKTSPRSWATPFGSSRSTTRTL